MNDSSDHIARTADIASAYVSNNSVAAADLSRLIISVHGALGSVATGKVEEPVEPLVPAVPIRKSITPDYLISLEDGKKYKSLKRHLRTSYDMTPQDYRAKWGLPADYPMVAPNYSAARSALAKTLGLGNNRKAAPAPAPAAVPAKRGRKVAA